MQSEEELERLEKTPLRTETRRQTLKQLCEIVGFPAIVIGFVGGINGTSWWSYVLAGGFGFMVMSA